MQKTSIKINPTNRALSSVNKKSSSINQINQIILEKMAQGKIAWQKSWIGESSALNAISKKPYKGVNSILLNMELEEGQSPYFATFNQIQELGGKLKKGSKGQPIFFFKLLDKQLDKQPEENQTQQTQENREYQASGKIPVLKRYSVFNLDDVDLPEEKRQEFEFKPQEVAKTPSEEEKAKINRVNQFLEQIKDKPLIEFKGTKAYYMPAKDLVRVPDKGRFTTVDALYQTLFHELAHASGHQKRLNREGIAKKSYFGSIDYSKEELIAELTSSYLASYCGTQCNFDNSAAYIDGWSEQIKDDPYFFITACNKAQKAYEYLTNQQTESKTEIN